MLGVCEPGEELRLGRKLVSYPQMQENPYEVEYWTGSYTRSVKAVRNYLHEAIDRCMDRTIVSERKTKTESWTQEFQIHNPNLDYDIFASYQLVPMSNDQAQAAFIKAKLDCETYTADLQ